jgi:hypothetical protein
MRFVLAYERCCPSELRAGEGKRVPRQPEKPVVGYYLGCPYCARPQVLVARLFDADTGYSFDEVPAGLTMHPDHTCDRCGKSFGIKLGKFVLS